MVAGKTCIVAGYGDVGKGSAQVTLTSIAFEDELSCMIFMNIYFLT